MGRNKKDLPPLYFIWNKSQAVALNTYILLYPKKWLNDLLNMDSQIGEMLWKSLNASAERIISQQTRVYSGELHKIEPGELKSLPIVDLPEKILKCYERIKNPTS
jgi:hypothetical protein